MSLPAPFKYQEYGHNKIVNRKRTAIIAPPGSGKTRPIITGLNEVGAFEGPILIVCSGSAIPTWMRQIPLWTEDPGYADSIHIVRGDRSDRLDLWEQASKGYGTYITNFNVFFRDYDAIKQIQWPVVIADEYHKSMRRHKGQTYKRFKSLTRHTPYLILATGSLVRRDASSMFTAFQLVDPLIWSSYWRFVYTFCHVDDTGFGKQVHGVKNAERLRSLMDETFCYWPPEVVADALPKGRRIALDVEITPEQRRIYNNLEEDMIAILPESGNIIMTPTVLAQLTKQRQLLCCPKILDESLGMGAGYEAIIDRLDMDDHVAIFVPYRPACDYIAADLQALGYAPVSILRGGVSADEQKVMVEEFKLKRGILVGTIQYAESFDLETCCTTYFLGYDLTVDQNEQAEGRTRRAISEHKFVTWNYIKTDTLVDAHFLGKLGADERNAKLILQRPEDYINKLKGA